MIKVFIFEGIEEEMVALENIFIGREDFKIVGKENDGRKGLAMVENLKPDLIITDCFVDTIDGVGVIAALCNRDKNCKIIMRMSYTIPTAITLAVNAGVDYIVQKNIDTWTFIKHCKNIFDDEVIFRKCNSKMKALIKQIVNATGLNPTHVGYGYVIEAVIMCYEHPEYLVCKKRGLYPRIADHHNVNDASVERAIHAALDSAWNKYKGNQFYKRVNCKCAPYYRTPTCSEFIGAIYKYISSTEVYFKI